MRQQKTTREAGAVQTRCFGDERRVETIETRECGGEGSKERTPFEDARGSASGDEQGRARWMGGRAEHLEFGSDLRASVLAFRVRAAELARRKGRKDWLDRKIRIEPWLEVSLFILWLATRPRETGSKVSLVNSRWVGYSSTQTQLQRYKGATVFNKVIYSFILPIVYFYFARKEFDVGKKYSRENLSLIRKSRALD